MYTPCRVKFVAVVVVVQVLLAVVFFTGVGRAPHPSAEHLRSSSDGGSRHGPVTNAPLPRAEPQHVDPLLQVYLQRYSELRVKGENLANMTCPSVLREKTPACRLPGCNTSSLPSLPDRLQRLLRIQLSLTAKARAVVEAMAKRSQAVDFAFVTAASANHFLESQGMVRGLHQVVFPELRRQGLGTFHLYYYDLGLTPTQLDKLKRHCGCTVLPFPFDQLPPHFHRLKTCVWKPLLLKAHLNSSRVTLWMDASTRWTRADIRPILQQAQQLGLFLARNNYMTLMHVHPAMLAYFQLEQPCFLASFYEIAGGFVALHNEEFVHRAVLDPWVACAFSTDCLCPMESPADNCERFLSCAVPRKGHFRCHRYDQTGLGMILTLLFDWRVTGLTEHLVSNTITPWFTFKRDNAVQYFP